MLAVCRYGSAYDWSDVVSFAAFRCYDCYSIPQEGGWLQGSANRFVVDFGSGVDDVADPGL